MAFRIDNRIVYALEYWFVTEPPLSRQVIIWLSDDGYDQWNTVYRPDRRPIVYTKPGETLIVHGEERVVQRVGSYRESSEGEVKGHEGPR